MAAAAGEAQRGARGRRWWWWCRTDSPPDGDAAVVAPPAVPIMDGHGDDEPGPEACAVYDEEDDTDCLDAGVANPEDLELMDVIDGGFFDDGPHVDDPCPDPREPHNEPDAQPEDDEPPAPPEQPQRKRAAPRAAEATVWLSGGRLCFYKKYENFEAVCGNPAHGPNCIVRRTPNRKFAGEDGMPRGGRPPGMLAAWLSLAFACKTREEHKDKAMWKEKFGSQRHRERHREILSATEGGQKLLTFERRRDLISKEPEEPVD